MSSTLNIRALWDDLMSAVQFLTRIPVPAPPYSENSPSRSTKFFPLVGVLVGGSAAVLYLLISSHLPVLVTAAIVLAYLVCLTGCFHEDALADAADGFGGGWDREQILTILRDSRIGSYGGTALAVSLLCRFALLASIAPSRIVPTLITAHVLCRWTTLPLSYFLPAARTENMDGQGVRIAKLTTRSSMVFGTVFSLALAVLLLRWRAIGALASVVAIALLSGLYYNRRIGGVTGDCFGATNQLAEIAVYIAGVWVL